MSENAAGRSDFPYDDIIGRSRPVSAKHPPMAVADRAAQFASFAALTGYGEQVSETARLTSARLEITEDRKNILDMRLCAIEAMIQENPPVVLTVYEPDEHKEGGRYITVSGRVRRIDPVERLIEFTDRRSFLIDDVYDIKL